MAAATSDGRKRQHGTAAAAATSGHRPGSEEEEDSMSTGWTDEKHCLYLNSIETSFVNQLYNNECHSNDLLGWSYRTQKHSNSSGSSASSLFSGQFKVQREGYWEKLKFVRAKRHVEIENQSRLLSANPWIQHFRSPSIGKEAQFTNSEHGNDAHITLAIQVDDIELASQSIHLASPRRGRNVSCCKQFPASSHLYLQDSVGSNTEVSDQNFVNEEIESGEQSCGTFAVAKSPVKDQVVPSGNLSVKPSSDEGHACLKGKTVECSSRKPKGIGAFPILECEPLLLNEQDLNRKDSTTAA